MINTINKILNKCCKKVTKSRIYVTNFNTIVTDWQSSGDCDFLLINLNIENGPAFPIVASKFCNGEDLINHVFRSINYRTFLNIDREDHYVIRSGNVTIKLGANLMEQNFQNHDNIFVRLRMKGGTYPPLDQIIFTNKYIKECEDQLLWELPCQSMSSIKMPEMFYRIIGQHCASVDMETIIILFEDVMTCIRHFMKSRNMNDIYHVAALFYRLRTGKSLTMRLTAYIEKFIKELFAAQSEEKSAFAKLRECFDNVEKFKKSTLVQKIMRVLGMIIALSICTATKTAFSLTNFLKIDKLIACKNFFSNVDVLSNIMELILFMCEKGYQCIVTGSFSCIFHSADQYEDWYMKCQKLKIQSKQLNDPEALGFSESEFLGNLDQTIEQGTDICRHLKDTQSYELKYMRQQLNELIFIQSEQLTTQKAREYRDAPFSILINGASSVGKSTITNMLFQHYGKLFDLPLEDKYKYTKNPVAKYWDGFKSYMWCLLIDDIAYMHPNAATNGDPSVMEVIQIQNNVPYVPDQASLEDKGRTPLRAKFCIATTNTKHLNAVHYFNCPIAVQRRLPIVVTVAPKPEYATNGFLDSAKTPKTTTYPDFWLWKVEKVEAGHSDRCSYKEVYSTSNVHEFLAYFSEQAVLFKEKQELIKTSHNYIREIAICKKCYRDKTVCICSGLPQQSFEFVHSIWMWFIVKFVLFYIKFRPGAILWLYPAMCFLGYKDEQIGKLHIRYIGDKIGNTLHGLKNYRYLLSIVAGLTTALAAYKMYVRASKVCGIKSESLDDQKTDSRNMEEEVARESEDDIYAGRKPAPRAVERENVWYQREYELSPCDVSEGSLSTGTLSLEKFQEMCWNNTITIEVHSDGKGSATSAFCLKGNVYLANNHSFKGLDEYFTMKIKHGVRNLGIQNEIETVMNISDIVQIPSTDLVLFTIVCIPPKRDLYKFIPVNKLYGTHVGFICSNFQRKRRSHAVRFAQTSTLNVVSVGYTMECYKCKISSDNPTDYGFCGSPFVIKNGMGYHIAGIHVAGSGEDVIEIAISQTQLNPYMEYFKTYWIANNNGVKLSAPSVEKTLLPLHEKSAIRYIDEGVCDVYGSISGFRATHKSQVEKTMMNDYFSLRGYKTKYTSPDLRSWRPKHLALKEMVKPQNLWCPEIVDKCVNAFFKDIISGLTEQDKRDLHILDLESNVNGVPGVAYIDALKRNTSAGFPWKRSKKNFLSYREDGQTVDVDDEILDEAKRIEECFKRGERANVVWSANLKDEPVTDKKAKMGKTRVFCCANFPMLLVMRKYLLTFIRVMQNNRFLFEAAPGTVAQSKEWGEIKEYLTKFGKDRIVCGDYGKFDKRMASIFIRAAFRLIRMILEWAGWPEKLLIVIDAIACEVAYPLIDFFGDLIQFFGGNPSGHSLTVIINCIVNSLYMRYMFHVITHMEPEEFKKFVALMTYGDDNGLGVSEKLPEFNHTTISKTLATYGVEYTMADKESESVPYIHINDATFLKRSWRYDEDVGAELCPLDHDSIEKMLMVNVRSRSIPHEAQCCAILDSAIREYFFYGKKVFEEKRALFCEAIQDLELVEWMGERTLPTWDELKNAFLQA